MGPSGSGKSTCARLAARLWDITAGRITVGGVDISTVDPEVLLTDYSMVFQDVVLFDDTVMEKMCIRDRLLYLQKGFPLGQRTAGKIEIGRWKMVQMLLAEGMLLCLSLIHI